MSAAPRPWALDDAEKRAFTCPSTFEIPGLAVREGLRVGWLAKLLFVPSQTYLGRRPFAERMWVRIAQTRDGGPRYVGVLVSRPVVAPLEAGDVVEFEARHVCDYVDVALRKERRRG